MRRGMGVEERVFILRNAYIVYIVCISAHMHCWMAGNRSVGTYRCCGEG